MLHNDNSEMMLRTDRKRGGKEKSKAKLRDKLSRERGLQSRLAEWLS